VTQAAEDGTCTSLLAYSGHASAASLARYARVSPEPSAAGRHSATRHAQVFRFAAGLAWRRQGAGVQVLEGNLRRVIGAEASGGELRAVQAGHALVRALLARGLPAAGDAGGPAGRVPVDQRGPVIARYREAAGRVVGPRCSRSCLMPGIIRCPNRQQSRLVIPVTGAEARNPAFLPAARVPGSDSGSAWSTLTQRCRRPAQRSLCAAGAEAVLAADGCLPAGQYRCAGRRPAVWRPGGDRGTNATGVARRDARRPGAAARHHGGHRLAWGGPAQRRFAGGQLMTEAWSCGGPGQVAGRGGCRWRAEVPGHLGRALPGRRRGTLDSVRIRSDPRRMRAPGPQRSGGRSSGFWQGGTGCA
jgi:hypothetical protein